jgi:hypothetical protein
MMGKDNEIILLIFLLILFYFIFTYQRKIEEDDSDFCFIKCNYLLKTTETKHGQLNILFILNQTIFKYQHPPLPPLFIEINKE